MSNTVRNTMRNRKFAFMLNEAEQRMLYALAARHHLSAANLMRNLIFKYALEAGMVDHDESRRD